MKHQKGKLRKLFRTLLVILLCTGMILPTKTSFASDSLDKQIDAARTALTKAEARQKAAAEKYSQGSLGFIDWMRAKPDLTELQKQDLDNARRVITKACEENFSKWAHGNENGMPAKRNNMVTCLNDLYDAVSLPNLERSFPILEDINNIRATDENYIGSLRRNEATTNFTFMAIAQTGADRGAGLGDHSLLQASCENLAFGYGKPAQAWRSEIHDFNAAKKELGLDVPASESEIREIRNLAESKGNVVGHYTNLFYAVDQVMGVGITDYNTTCCFNASDSAYNSSKMPYYTIREFQALFNEYYATVNPDTMQADVDAAAKALDALLQQSHSNCIQHTYGSGTYKAPTCQDSGGTVYTCVRCGYEMILNPVDALGHDLRNGVCTRCGTTGPTEIQYISWYLGETINQSDRQSYMPGHQVDIFISYTSASEYPDKDKFIIDIANPDVISYEPSSNYTGTMHMNAPGETTVTIYPAVNPSLAKTYTISVTEPGGHNFAINPTSEPGSGKTTKTCSTCGMTKTVTLPTDITKLVWWKNGYGKDTTTYSPKAYRIGEFAEISLEYSPYDAENHEFVILTSDSSVASVSESKQHAGIITMRGRGEVTITIYAKYDPSVKREYTFQVVGENEDISDISDNDPYTQPTAPGTAQPTKPANTKPTAASTPQASRPTAASTPQASRPTAASTPQASRPTAPGAAQPTKPANTRPTAASTPQASRPTAAPDADIPDDAEPFSLSDASVSLSASVYTYDGSIKQPAVTEVRLGADTLHEGTDYVITYDNNINIGTATVTVTGIGPYTGSITKTFTIRAKNGTFFTSGSCQYKVTGQNTVSCTGLTSDNAKNVTVPKNVIIGGKSFSVTAVAKKAFAQTDLQKAVIGANIQTIGANAFKDCRNLKTIIIKSQKLTSVGKNACRGIHKTARIKVPARQYSACKKLFKNKGQGNKVKISKSK